MSEEWVRGRVEAAASGIGGGLISAARRLPPPRCVVAERPDVGLVKFMLGVGCGH
ncbi:hypothetical protein [Streptomyces pseudovenezuelae]|uniref:hypothetical protein n=1 Tax=Streptomyces pseudovenezuelae TaxID=67350 RepID=UPI0036F12100